MDKLEQLHLEEKQEISKYTAMAICDLIDDIELSCKDTSLKEWKMFKRIRNTIRDKFVLNK